MSNSAAREKEAESNIQKEMLDFCIRILRGDGTPQETAILPEVLRLALKK